MELFKNKDNEFYENDFVESENIPYIPNGLWFKCEHCENTIYLMDVKEDKTCPKCSNYYRMSAFERINFVCDENSFSELSNDLKGVNYLNYPNYDEKLEMLKKELSIDEAVITGTCSIGNMKVCIGVMDSRFIMASMGSVVGEKLTRLFEYATENNLPVLIYSASGGARMQEGIISLMQMAKVSMACKKHSDKGLLYITYLTDPTMGGVTASFAMLGDIILAEPKALVGFAGKRVIMQTIKEELPDDFQTAEMLLKTGFVDRIVPRSESKSVLQNILELHNCEKIVESGDL